MIFVERKEVKRCRSCFESMKRLRMVLWEKNNMEVQVEKGVGERGREGERRRERDVLNVRKLLCLAESCRDNGLQRGQKDRLSKKGSVKEKEGKIKSDKRITKQGGSYEKRDCPRCRCRCRQVRAIK